MHEVRDWVAIPPGLPAGRPINVAKRDAWCPTLQGGRVDGTRKRQVERHGVVPSDLERAISSSRGAPDDTEYHRVDCGCHAVTRAESPRLKLVNALTESLRAALAAGDLGVANVAHEALGRVLGDAKGDVADLDEERAKRGRAGR